MQVRKIVFLIEQFYTKILTLSDIRQKSSYRYWLLDLFFQ